MNTPKEVALEANLTAEFAGLSKSLTFTAREHPNPEFGTLIWANGTFDALVNNELAIKNIKACADDCTHQDLLRAIRYAHPLEKKNSIS